MERELFICNCENIEHQIVFSWFEDDDVANVYATIHLRKKSFWKRLKYGIKYIFGYQCRYGAFDEFIFNPSDAYMLKRVYDFLIGAYREKMNMDIDKLIEDYEPEENKEFYDVYHGFFSWFRTKWMGARYGLTEKELSKYINELVVKLRNNVKIIWEI